jgi:acyl-CoA synthetase (AMP-forming)/AMP-acid ligase II
MATINNQLVVGVFHRWEDAQAAIEHLRNVNVDSGEIASYDKSSDQAGLLARNLPEYELKYYQTAFTHGHVVVMVDTATRQAEVAEILNQHGAENIVPGPGVDPNQPVPRFDGLFDHRDDSESATTGFSAMAPIQDALKHTPFHIPSTGKPDETIPPLNFEDPTENP